MAHDNGIKNDAPKALTDAGWRVALVAALAAGYALQHLHDCICGRRDAMDDGDVRFEQDRRASDVAARHLVEWFRKEGVTFSEDLQPVVPMTTLDFSRLNSVHAEAMHLALEAIHSAADVTEDLWSDRDFLFIWVVQHMSLEAFRAGPPNQLAVRDRQTGEMVELVREVCARLKSTGRLVDLDGVPVRPFPRAPFPSIKGLGPVHHE